jgi:two-component system phosphate regulon response regulator PhoB
MRHAVEAIESPLLAANGQPSPAVEAHIVVACADSATGQPLARALATAAHRVTFVTSGTELLELAGKETMNALVLDVGLAHPDWTALISTLRVASATRTLPILVTMDVEHESERVRAFELGADDVVATPFSVREVLLRIRVQLRARRDAGQASILEVGKLRLDRTAHRVWVGTELAELSATEFRLLEVLMERKERVLARHVLLDLVWGSETSVGVRAVDAYVTRLRRRLGEARDHVETVSSIGYRMKAVGSLL